MKTYNDYLKLMNEVNTIAGWLSRLGINIESCFIKFTYNEIDYIREAIKKEDIFNCGLPLDQSVALCLACTEENRNNHIDDDEIAFVNKFFNLKVTRELVSKMHSKYI